MHPQLLPGRERYLPGLQTGRLTEICAWSAATDDEKRNITGPLSPARRGANGQAACRPEKNALVMD